MEWAVFIFFAVAALVGAGGVVMARRPVHAALSLVLTLFSVAVFFVLQGAHFLAAVQVIVYAGAIVVLFLFVIMLLGVDRDEAVEVEQLKGQRPVAIGLGVLVLALVVLLARFSHWATGAPSARGAARGPTVAGAENVELLGRSIFTDFQLPFEVTAVLLVIAVVGAVVLARRPPRFIEEAADRRDG
jgi:NADH-quinone oxidoreductase subunit J